MKLSQHPRAVQARQEIKNALTVIFIVAGFITFIILLSKLEKIIPDNYKHNIKIIVAIVGFSIFIVLLMLFIIGCILQVYEAFFKKYK